MLRGNNVIGMPVVAVDRGAEVDHVRDLVLDRNSRRVVALLIEKEGWFNGQARVLPLSRVQAFGPSAIMVQSAGEIVPAEQAPDIQEAIAGHAKCAGASLMTFDGRKLGTVKDIEFDEKTGRIGAFEVSGGIVEDVVSGRSLVRPGDNLVVGEELVIVGSDAPMEPGVPPLDSITQSLAPAFDPQASVPPPPPKKAPMGPAPTGPTSTSQVPGSPFAPMPVKAGSAAPVASSAYTAEPPVRSFAGQSPDGAPSTRVDNFSPLSNDAALSDDPALQSELALTGKRSFNGTAPDAELVGRRVEREVRVGDEVLLKAGDVITVEALEKARDAGALERLKQRTAPAETLDSAGEREGA